jgi:hypothetical protein
MRAVCLCFDLEHIAHAVRARQQVDANGVEGVDVDHHRVPCPGKSHFQLRHEHGQLVQDKLAVPRCADLVHAPTVWHTIISYAR